MTNPDELRVHLDAGAVTTALVYAATGTPIGATLILGHGAGAGQRSTFMVDFSRALSALGLDVVTFNFLYTEQGRKIPDRAPALEACYLGVIAATRSKIASAQAALFIGGKSMGGRMATHVAAADAALPIAGLVLLGYPLHPPGKPEQRRDKHLPAITRPMLFVQGERDAFGTPAELAPALSAIDPPPTVHAVEKGDHSLKVSRVNPGAQAAVYANVQQTIVDWIRARVPAGTR